MKRKSLLPVFLFNLSILIAIIGFVEANLRLFTAHPKGIFLGWTPGEHGLYPEDSEILMPGPVPYTVKTNSEGFRGRPISPTPEKGVIRVAAVGDSITDGFFVDNEYTYPHLLEERLREMGWAAEVVNAAHGGGSIDKELEILRERVVQLNPHIVVLTFVTNDISDIAGKSRRNLIDSPDHLKGPEFRNTPFLLFITKTAIGEFLYDAYLAYFSPTYSKARASVKDYHERYSINGGANYERNSRLFLSRFSDTDGLVLTEPFSRETNALLKNYFFVLSEFKSVCIENGIDLALVYFPAYSQIYDRTSSDRIQLIMSEKAQTLGIPFLDLTRAFREDGRKRVLHLAPLDFHLNPDGNTVLANEIANFLADSILDQHRMDEASFRGALLP